MTPLPDPSSRHRRCGGPAALGRRTLLGRLLLLGMGAWPVAGLVAGCSREMPGPGGDRMPDGRSQPSTPGWMMDRRQLDEQMMQHMRVIRRLLTCHDEIDRRVEDAPGGIRSWTTSRDPEVADLIRTHAHQMRGRVESGDPIRQMDPLFGEIFDHHDAIEMTVTDVPGGVRVTETSPDGQVELLIVQPPAGRCRSSSNAGWSARRSARRCPRFPALTEGQHHVMESMMGGMGGGMMLWMLLWGLGGLIVVVLAVLGIVWLVRRIGRGGKDPLPSYPALAELRRRYAAGEIGEDEYHHRRGQLE